MLALRTSGILISICVSLSAQQAANLPRFEIASIKLSPEPPGNSGIAETKGRINAKNVTLRRCVRGAYNIPEPQVLGGPKWIDDDRYDIQATASGPVSGHDLMLMLQTLLSDRFKLTLHREQRIVPGLRLVLSKSGLKAHASLPDRNSVGESHRGQITAEGYTMAQLALKLSEVLRQPVLNATNLTGKFDFDLKWAPDDLQAKLDAGPSIFAALREQLGLELKSDKVSAEVLVIDSVEKPTEN